MHVVLCTCGVVFHACGVVYMWYYVHIVQVVLCTCGVMYTLSIRCCVHVVQVVLCTFCMYGTGVNVVLGACRTCCVVGRWYYVCAFCSHGIVTCIHCVEPCVCIVLCYTLGLGVCLLIYIKCRCMHCVVSYTVCGCMYCDVNCVCACD